MKSPVIIDGVRTAIGRAHPTKGVFRDVRSDDLAVHVVRALVERTGIDRSTLADIVGRLLGRGLIQRRRAKDDARAYAIKLTPQGAKALREAQPGATAADQKLLASLPPAKRQEFLESLNLIVTAIRK